MTKLTVSAFLWVVFTVLLALVIPFVLLLLLFVGSNCVDYGHDHELRTSSTASATRR